MKKMTLKQAVAKLLAFKWNKTNRQYVAAYILRYTDRGEIITFLEAELARMSKADFDHYYGDGILETARLALELAHNSNAELLHEILRQSRALNPYISHNYPYLLAAGVHYLITEFDTSFRGRIRTVHKVHDIVVIETVDDNKDTRFYTVDKLPEDRCRIKGSAAWSTVEDAILYHVFGNDFMAAAQVLAEAARAKK